MTPKEQQNCERSENTNSLGVLQDACCCLLPLQLRIILGWSLTPPIFTCSFVLPFTVWASKRGEPHLIELTIRSDSML